MLQERGVKPADSSLRQAPPREMDRRADLPATRGGTVTRRIDAGSAPNRATPDLQHPALAAPPGLAPAAHSYTTQVWRKADEIDADAWNRLCDPVELFMDLRLLSVIEKSLAGDADFWYVLF